MRCKLRTCTLSFLLHSVGQSKSQSQLRFRGWGHRVYHFMEELQSYKVHGFREAHAIVPSFAFYHIWMFHDLAHQSWWAFKLLILIFLRALVNIATFAFKKFALAYMLISSVWHCFTTPPLFYEGPFSPKPYQFIIQICYILLFYLLFW